MVSDSPPHGAHPDILQRPQSQTTNKRVSRKFQPMDTIPSIIPLPSIGEDEDKYLRGHLEDFYDDADLTLVETNDAEDLREHPEKFHEVTNIIIDEPQTDAAERGSQTLQTTNSISTMSSEGDEDEDPRELLEDFHESTHITIDELHINVARKDSRTLQTTNSMSRMILRPSKGGDEDKDLRELLKDFHEATNMIIDESRLVGGENSMRMSKRATRLANAIFRKFELGSTTEVNQKISEAEYLQNSMDDERQRNKVPNKNTEDLKNTFKECLQSGMTIKSTPGKDLISRLQILKDCIERLTKLMKEMEVLPGKIRLFVQLWLPIAADRKCGCKCLETCGCACDCKCNCICREKCEGHCEDSLPSTPRNLVVCIDGTSNQFGKNNTNVVELCSRIIRDDNKIPQLAYYNSGIGTYVPPSGYSLASLRQSVWNTLDLAFALNFETIVQGAYRWLSDHYQPGDKIYLFGFSRGAFQIRVLAAMIEKVGLMYPGNVEQIPFAYELFVNRYRGKDIILNVSETTPTDFHDFESKNGAEFTGKSTGDTKTITSEKHSLESRDSTPAPGKITEELAKKFKNTFSRKVGTHFVGAWDTVSSIGLFRGPPLPLTNTCEHICIFRHALALDERRVKFLPEYVNGGASLSGPNDYRNEGSKTGDSDLASPSPAPSPESYSSKGYVNGVERIKEVWFAGTHSDIGGGNRQNIRVDLATPPLLWMENEAMSAGLRLKLWDFNEAWDTTKLSTEKVKESMVKVWPLLEYIPFTQLTYETPASTERLRHLRKGRVIVDGQKIHASLAFKNPEYTPAAQNKTNNLDWKSLIGSGKEDGGDLFEKWKSSIPLEKDVFDYSLVEHQLKQLQELQNSDDDHQRLFLLRCLRFAASTERGALKINESKGIAIIANMLRRSDRDVNKSSADCLFDILSKISIHDEDGDVVNALRDLLQREVRMDPPHPNSLHCSVQVLSGIELGSFWNFWRFFKRSAYSSLDDETMEHIRNVIARLLNSEDHQIVVSQYFSRLARLGTSIRGKLLSDEVICGISNILEKGKDDARKFIAEALAALSTESYNRDADVDVMKPNLVKAVSIAIKNWAISLDVWQPYIINLCSSLRSIYGGLGETERKSTLEDIFQIILKLLADCDEKAERCAISDCIENLVGLEHDKAAFQKFLSSLSALLSRQEEPVKFWAAQSIGYFAESEGFENELLPMLEKLVQMMNNDNSVGVSLACAVTIRSYVSNNKCRSEVSKIWKSFWKILNTDETLSSLTGTLEKCEAHDFFQTTNGKISKQRCAKYVLLMLANYEDSATLLLDGGAIDDAIKTLQGDDFSNQPDKHMGALEFLNNMAIHDSVKWKVDSIFVDNAGLRRLLRRRVPDSSKEKLGNLVQFIGNDKIAKEDENIANLPSESENVTTTPSAGFHAPTDINISESPRKSVTFDASQYVTKIMQRNSTSAAILILLPFFLRKLAILTTLILLYMFFGHYLTALPAFNSFGSL